MTPTMTEQRALTELEKLLAETRKLVNESTKLNAEAAKFDAERHKLLRDAFWQPIGIASALIGAVAAVTTIALKLLGLLA